MRTFSRYLLESPLDELPETVDGPHPHERVNTYEEEKDSAIRDENWPPQADLGFTSTHIYQDPDSGIKTHIEMDHATPGWTGRQHPGLGVARCAVEANGMFGDSSITGSRFHMPGEIMGKIASSSSHLHDFITKYNPHTVEYSTTDPKRHALYQHMGRHLYPHIWFNNVREVEPIKRKPKKALTDSVNLNYWNTANINKFILESPLDELPAAVEGTHPHETENSYEDQKSEAGHWMKMHPHEAPISFNSTHTYHDPDGRVTTHIEMQHRTPGWDFNPHPSTGVATVGVSVGGVYQDSSQTGSRFHMPGEIMGKIASSSSHLHDFITKYKPHTIEYDTDDPKRHALYQHMSRLYPRILFRNTGELKPVERKPKKAVAVSESYSKKQMRVANQTSRNSGAIGKKAITPAYVKTITSKKHKILDFGSGRDAAHTKSLRKSGRNVTAHEFGANVNQNHDPKALEKKYDTVFASNVLNTASSHKMLSDTLDQMHSAVAPGGALVANLPLSPRKSVKVDAKHLMRQLLNRFGDVRRVGGTKKAPLFHAIGPK